MEKGQPSGQPRTNGEKTGLRPLAGVTGLRNRQKAGSKWDEFHLPREMRNSRTWEAHQCHGGERAAAAAERESSHRERSSPEATCRFG